MTNEFCYLMELLAAASIGYTVSEPDKPINWSKVLQLANEQSILPLVAYALKRAKLLSCPEDIEANTEANLRSTAIRNIIQQTAVLKLLEQFESISIHAVLLKGYAIAGLYAAPECRVSSDADIYIEQKDEQRACNLLRSEGFTIASRRKNEHHAVCHHPKIGCIELHVSLFDDMVESVWYKDIDKSVLKREPYLKVSCADGAFYTLGYTDHLLFLVLHMMKHFISNGMSLRSMMDVSLYCKTYRDHIDFERFWMVLDKLKYRKTVNAVMWAMIRYCEFDVLVFPGISDFEPDCVQLVLDDLEKGGWMGQNDRNARADGGFEYNRQIILKDKKQWQYKVYMVKWQLGGLTGEIFPTRERLAEKYPYLNERPFLMPYAWLLRMRFLFTKYIFKRGITRRIINDDSELANSSKERIDLFKKLEIL